MADDPKFPSPEAAKRKNADVKIAPSEPRAAVVVHRAEPAPPSEPAKAAKAPKMTPEEVRALLEVSGANRGRIGSTLWRRGRVIMVPTGLLCLLVDLVFGSRATPFASSAIVILALLWAARPLWKRDDWS
jgi:hypothetical protein